MAKSPSIPNTAIFIEKDGWAYYVTNWKTRFTFGGRAVVVRLSARHFARYHQLKEKGRSEKTICYLLFGRASKAPVPAPRKIAAAIAARSASGTARISTPSRNPTPTRNPTAVAVDISILTTEQLYALVNARLGIRIPGLRTLPLADLRRLYLALIGLATGS